MAIDTVKEQTENEEGCGTMVDKGMKHFEKRGLISKEKSLTMELRRMNHSETVPPLIKISVNLSNLFCDLWLPNTFLQFQLIVTVVEGKNI